MVFVGLLGILVVLGSIALNNQYSQATTLGGHTEALKNVRSDLKREADDIRKVVREIHAEHSGQLKKIQDSLNVTELDIGKVLVSMGVVERGDVFDALVYDNDVWIVPGTVLREKLVAKGLEYTKISPKVDVFGFKVFSATAANGNNLRTLPEN